MVHLNLGSENTELTSRDLMEGLNAVLDKLGKRQKVLIVPPDFTRYHSMAGELTSYAYTYYKDSLKAILPALGTHAAMTKQEVKTMFPGIPERLFRIHDWRRDVITCGTVPGEFISQITGNLLDFDWPAQLNSLVYNGDHDLILSVGQVVPHEVVGMANHSKNLFVGTGGSEGINKSHFIGAVYGMERIMGKANNPLRQLLKYASDNFIRHLPVIYVLTVIGRNNAGKLVPRGLFIGDDEEVFLKASELSVKVNFTMLENPLKKVLVYLDPDEYKSTWLGNKSIYRTRMAMADGGELIVLAPGLKEFGEDPEIDRLIRKYGYRGTAVTLKASEDNMELRDNLSAAAHLIHGSTEGRFTVTYCTGNLTKKEIESVNFSYDSLDNMTDIYEPGKLKDGFNTLSNGEEIFYISNPATGLWSTKERFDMNK